MRPLIVGTGQIDALADSGDCRVTGPGLPGGLVWARGYAGAAIGDRVAVYEHRTEERGGHFVPHAGPYIATKVG